MAKQDLPTLRGCCLYPLAALRLRKQTNQPTVTTKGNTKGEIREKSRNSPARLKSCIHKKHCYAVQRVWRIRYNSIFKITKDGKVKSRVAQQTS